MAHTARRNEQTLQNLQIDNVLSTQPELGPHIPDGGYGWIILFIVAIFQMVIPSIIVAHGMCLMVILVEFNIDDVWITPFILTPILYASFSILISPWSIKIIKDNRWPKFIAYSGFCFICAGLLMFWYGVHDGVVGKIIYIFSGIFTGVVASLLAEISDTLIHLYFKLKLKHVTSILRICTAFGYILTPFILGPPILDIGVSKTLFWYQGIILVLSIITAMIKKPIYLRSNLNEISTPYKLMQFATEDEEDVFSKSSKELGTRVRSEKVNNRSRFTSFNNEDTHVIDDYEGNENIHSTSENWVDFNESENTRKDSITKQQLKFSFTSEAPELSKNQFEDDFVSIPTPIYNDIQINNNISYAYDTTDTLPSTSAGQVFVFDTSQRSCLRRYIEFLEDPRFYLILIQTITKTFSIFMLFILFPSYIYSINNEIHIGAAIEMLGGIGSIGLLYTLASISLETLSVKKKELILAVSTFLGCCGYMNLAFTPSAIWVNALSALLIFLNINTFEHLGGIVVKSYQKKKTSNGYLCLCSICGLMFSIFLIFDFKYTSSFILMAVLHLLTSLGWTLQYIVKSSR